MDALGVAIIHFLAEDPPPDQIQAVQERITAQIREWSSTSPLLQHSLRKPRGQSSDPEPVKALLRERPAGANIATLIFDDYYRHSVGGMAFRDRLKSGAGRATNGSQMCGCWRESGASELHASGAGEILLLAQNETFAEIAEVTCIDNRPADARSAAN